MVRWDQVNTAVTRSTTSFVYGLNTAVVQMVYTCRDIQLKNSICLPYIIAPSARNDRFRSTPTL